MSERPGVETVLDLDAAHFPTPVQALWQQRVARRAVHGEQLGGPYLALFNHPELAKRVEELGFYLKFEGTLPRAIYQFVVLSVARATGAGFEWQDHLGHARAAGLPSDVIEALASNRLDALPHPYDLAHAILAKTLVWQELPLELQRQAVAEWGDKGLLEIVVLSGFYQMFAAINNAFGIA